MFFIAVWQLIAVLMNKEYILPTPVQAVVRAAEIFSQADSLKAALFTLSRWLLGLAPALLLGITLGAVCVAYPRVGAFFSPVFAVIKSIPIVAVILLALVWFSAPLVPSFAVFLAAFPSAYENSAAGMRNVDRRLVEMAKVYRFSKSKLIFKLYLPSIRPYAVAALKTAAGVGLKAVVVSELVVQPAISVGANMQLARVTLQTDLLVAWTLLIVLTGYLIDLLLGLAERNAAAKYSAVVKGIRQ